MPAVRRHFRADSGRQRDDNLLAVAFVQEREQLEPAFVLPQIDGDRNVGEHAREVRVPHIAIDHQRRDSARHTDDWATNDLPTPPLSPWKK